MPFDAPFHLGPFAVGPDGSLALAAPDRAPCLRIDWRGCTVQARLRADAAGRLGELALHAVVGQVPSSAGRAAGRREAVFAALRSLPATLPDGWCCDLLADHRVAMLSATRLAMPTTVDSLLTDVTLFLLALGPYLDLLGELGVESAAGMVNTCPG